ncbi:hypothetical protein, partial [Pseudomonas syringae group genomosp. 7]|uniref:hypothetical protein n=1 Tax=Pseudomonas syringae group genomosp. 7 TaxID=251699 RepID=UPI0037704F13
GWCWVGFVLFGFLGFWVVVLGFWCECGGFCGCFGWFCVGFLLLLVRCGLGWLGGVGWVWVVVGWVFVGVGVCGVFGGWLFVELGVLVWFVGGGVWGLVVGGVRAGGMSAVLLEIKPC